MKGRRKSDHLDLRASRLSLPVKVDVSTLLSNAPASFAFHLSFERSMRSLRGRESQDLNRSREREKEETDMVRPMTKMMTLRAGPVSDKERMRVAERVCVGRTQQ